MPAAPMIAALVATLLGKSMLDKNEEEKNRGKVKGPMAVGAIPGLFDDSSPKITSSLDGMENQFRDFESLNRIGDAKAEQGRPIRLKALEDQILKSSGAEEEVPGVSKAPASMKSEGEEEDILQKDWSGLEDEDDSKGGLMANLLEPSLAPLLMPTSGERHNMMTPTSSPRDQILALLAKMKQYGSNRFTQ